VHVSFARNQHLAGFKMTVVGSGMQSGALETGTEHQKQHKSINTTQFKISNKNETQMRTGFLHPRQLCLQLAAGTLPRGRTRQRHAERCVGNWNRKWFANVKRKKKMCNTKISNTFQT
jgi:hypothetical protein